MLVTTQYGIRSGLRPAHAFLIAAILLTAGCSKKEESSTAAAPAAAPPPMTGTVTVEAKVSAGKNFRMYVNNGWSSPGVVEVVPNQWSQYQFPIPSDVNSIRFDPSDAGDASAEIRRVHFEWPGRQARSLYLEDLTKWGRSNCTVTFDLNSKLVTIKGLGGQGGQYLMATVNTNYMRQE